MSATKDDKGKPDVLSFYYSGYFPREHIVRLFEDVLMDLSVRNAYPSGAAPSLASLNKSLSKAVNYEDLAAVAEFGAKKYGRFNYKKGFKYSQPLNAAGRHIIKHFNGEKLDDESGLPHLAHAQANICMLLDNILHGAGTNDLIEEKSNDE